MLLGIAVFVVLRANRSQPEEVVSTEEARTVRFIEVPELTVVPRALGFGTVTPGKVWESVAEVAGKVSELHPDLKKGALIAAGEVLLRIDSTDYELEVARAETDIQATEAQSSELAIKETNTRASLAIEEQVLALGEKDLERRRKLVDRGTVTRSEFEEDERQVLAQRQGVQSLQNSLNLIPAEKTIAAGATRALSNSARDSAPRSRTYHRGGAVHRPSRPGCCGGGRIRSPGRCSRGP